MNPLAQEIAEVAYLEFVRKRRKPTVRAMMFRMGALWNDIRYNAIVGTATCLEKMADGSKSTQDFLFLMFGEEETLEPCIHELMNEYVPEYYSWEWPNSDVWDREEIVYFIAHCLSCLAWTMNEGNEFAPLAEYTELEVKQWLEERNRKEARVVVRKNAERGQIVQLRMI